MLFGYRPSKNGRLQREVVTLGATLGAILGVKTGQHLRKIETNYPRMLLHLRKIGGNCPRMLLHLLDVIQQVWRCAERWTWSVIFGIGQLAHGPRIQVLGNTSRII